MLADAGGFWHWQLYHIIIILLRIYDPDRLPYYCTGIVSYEKIHYFGNMSFAVLVGDFHMSKQWTGTCSGNGNFACWSVLAAVDTLNGLRCVGGGFGDRIATPNYAIATFDTVKPLKQVIYSPIFDLLVK